MTIKQYELNCEILQSLDKIDDCVMESETLVMDSIMDAYSKAALVLENCSDTADISSFNIIQESFILEDGEGNNKEKLIKKILLFIPRMIKKFIDFLLSKTGIGNDMKKLVTRIDELEKMSKSDKEKIIQLMKDNKDNEEKIIQLSKDAEVTDRKLSRVDENLRETTGKVSVVSGDQWKISRDYRRIRDLYDDLHDNVNRNSNRNEERFNDIEDVINVMNGNIMTTLDFDKIKMTYDDMVKMFEVLEKYDIHKPSTLSEDIRQQISSGKTIYDTAFDIRTTGGVPKLIKIPVFRQYMNDILDLRIEITQIGQRVKDKLNEQAKVFNNHTKLDDLYMVSKYITKYISAAKELESYISADMKSVLDHFNSIKRVHIKAESK